MYVLGWVKGETDCCVLQDVNTAMLPKPAEVAKHQKISRLRAISHQIR